MERRFVLQEVQKIDGAYLDIVIEGDRIVELAEAGTAQGEIIPCQGMYISSGWIDMHVHAFSKFDPYGDLADEIGYKQGVTTIVDAGSCGADHFDEFVVQMNQATTNVLAFLNISQIGLSRKDELSNLLWINREKAKLAILENKGLIVGLKARISQSVVCENGIAPLLLAKEMARENELKLMVHIGSGPPNIEEIIVNLDTNDILTHFLNGKENNLFNHTGKPLQVLTDAVKRGVHLDVGHGGASFSFEIAEYAKSEGIHFNTISSDIYKTNRLNGPVYSLAKVMSKFLAIGYSLEEVINGVTKQPADWLKKPELGRIQVGDIADLTLFSVENHLVDLEDSHGETRIGTQEIVAKGVVIHGKYYPCEVRTKASH